MGKITETMVDTFSEGMQNDPRSKVKGGCRVSKHFDILTDPHRMVPYLSHETEDASASTYKFCQILSTASTLKHYALGVVSGTTKPKIFERSPASGAWSASTTAEGANTGRNEDIFIEYKDLLYGATTSNFWTYTISSNTFTDNARAISFTQLAPLIVHSLDDIMYFGYSTSSGTFIGKNNNGSWTDQALTLPSNLVVTAICEYGVYLAIACRSKYSNGKSVVYLWDRDSSLTTTTAKIDWGTGDLTAIQEFNGALIGITKVASTGTLQSRIILKAYNGVGAVVFKEFRVNGTYIHLRPHTIRANKRVYFMAAFNLAAPAYVGFAQTAEILEGVFSVGVNEQGRFTVQHERVLNNDTDTTLTSDANSKLLGFFLQGDYIYVQYVDGTTYTALRSNAAGNEYSATSIHESLIFNAGDSSLKKDLVGVSVMHEPLLSSASVIVKYRVDATATWSSAILTSNTDDAISASVSSGAGSFPKDYKELQLRIESTGGAVITGYSFQEEITGKRAYDAIK